MASNYDEVMMLGGQFCLEQCEC